LIIQEWKNVRNVIQEGLMQEFNQDNHLFMISDSGARGKIGYYHGCTRDNNCSACMTWRDLECGLLVPIWKSFSF
ncbi:MAG: hypothetical protein Q8755_03225, partial [Candidatus Phytoplasma australasiaticum]|nr:hypothetical protein [Candidatus Phytoplasma australasiaticum]